MFSVNLLASKFYFRNKHQTATVSQYYTKKQTIILLIVTLNNRTQLQRFKMTIAIAHTWNFNVLKWQLQMHTPDPPRRVPTWIRSTPACCHATKTLKPTESRRRCIEARRFGPKRFRRLKRPPRPRPRVWRHDERSAALLWLKTLRPERGGGSWRREGWKRERLAADKPTHGGREKWVCDSK